VFKKVFGKETEPATVPLAVFLEYCRLRRDIEADRLQHLRIDELHRFRELRSRFSACAFDDLYARWNRDGDVAISSTDAYPPNASPCVLGVHELGFRYDEQHPARLTKANERQVT
jgi:hypothetical protein